MQVCGYFIKVLKMQVDYNWFCLCFEIFFEQDDDGMVLLVSIVFVNVFIVN